MKTDFLFWWMIFFYIGLIFLCIFMGILTIKANNKKISKDKVFVQKLKEKKKRINKNNKNAIIETIPCFVLVFILFFFEKELRARNLESLMGLGSVISIINLISISCNLNNKNREIKDEIILEMLNAKKEEERIIIELEMHRKVRIEIERIIDYWHYDENGELRKSLPDFNPFKRGEIGRVVESRFKGMKATVPLNKKKEELNEIMLSLEDKIQELERRNFTTDFDYLRKIEINENFLTIKAYKIREIEPRCGFEQYSDLKICEYIKEVTEILVGIIENNR